MNDGRKEYTFLWFIENFSYQWKKNGKLRGSPKFAFDRLEGTAWYIDLYSRDYRAEDKGNISLNLRRSPNDVGPEYFSTKYELSLLAVDGSAFLSRDFEFTFTKGSENEAHQFVQTDEIYLRRKDEYLPNDTLSVRCKMWKGEGDPQNAEIISARTRFLKEKICFLHTVECFSSLRPNVKKAVKIQSHLYKGNIMHSFSLYYIDGSGGKEAIMMEISSSTAQEILRKCKFSLRIGSGNLIKCGEIDYAYDAERISIHKLPLSITREDVLNRKNEYLQKDKLILLCECTFSTDLPLHTIEEVRPGLPTDVIKQKNNNADSKNVEKAALKISEYTNALEDIKAIYISQRITDVEVKTKTKSFPAHRLVLFARSPVFEAMLTTDMKEKITSCIQVDDLENDTVQQLLLFLYSDHLENLQWESATQLYYAADKYQIAKLKAMCSSFLVENLNISNVSEILLLSDTHNDSNLMKIVEDFILKHEEQVYSSSGWERLKETNPQLFINTMCLKYKRIN